MGKIKTGLKLGTELGWWATEKAMVPLSFASTALTTISPKQGMLEKAIDGYRNAFEAAGNFVASASYGGLPDVARTLQDKLRALSDYNFYRGAESIVNLANDPWTTAYAAAIALTAGLGAHYASKPIRKRTFR
ncbi:hypothetical protein J4430_04145 [Candidatus Woesearchaeota archaeon]|nr:hypothetical protein [Candidatus Woesearchaeota archaeon]